MNTRAWPGSLLVVAVLLASGALAREADSLPPGAPEIARIFANACDGGGVEACWALGQMYAQGHIPSAAATDVAKLFRVACSDELRLGCFDAAIALIDPPGSLPTSADSGWQELFLSCGSGTARGCPYILAALERKSAGYPAGSVERAMVTSQLDRFHYFACTGGFHESCESVPNITDTATPAAAGAPSEVSLLPANADPVTKMAAASCDGGNAIGCFVLGMRYDNSIPSAIAKDENHALSLYDRACNEATAVGCLFAGSILMDPADFEATQEGLQLASWSCDEGNAGACEMLADRSQQTANLSENLMVRVGASMLYIKACAFKDDKRMPPKSDVCAKARQIVNL